jgi:cytochrome c oxidase assembly factor CtaG
VSTPQLLVSHWHTAWSLDAEAAIAVILYLWGAVRVRGGWPWRRTLSFLAGVGCVVVALQSGFDAFDDRLLSAHMVQHVLLLLPAPLALLCGRPVTLVLRLLAPERRAKVGSALAGSRRLAHPLLCLAVFYAVVLGTHIPAVFDAALKHPAIHYAQHVLYLAGGMLFLWPVVGDPASSKRLSGLAIFGYIVASMPACALVGAYLNRAPSLVYAAYGPPAHALGISALNDQAQAGAIMWVGAHMILVALALWCMLSSIRAEERRQRALDARVLPPAAP